MESAPCRAKKAPHHILHVWLDIPAAHGEALRTGTASIHSEDMLLLVGVHLTSWALHPPRPNSLLKLHYQPCLRPGPAQCRRASLPPACQHLHGALPPPPPNVPRRPLRPQPYASQPAPAPDQHLCSTRPAGLLRHCSPPARASGSADHTASAHGRLSHRSHGGIRLEAWGHTGFRRLGLAAQAPTARQTGSRTGQASGVT